MVCAGVCGCGYTEAGICEGAMVCVHTLSGPGRCLPIRLFPGTKWCVCARGMGRESMPGGVGAGEAYYLDADEDDLNGREDELQLRLAVDVAHTVAHTEDIEADGAVAEEQ